MRTEKRNVENLILHAMINSLIGDDFMTLCMFYDHNPGDTFQIKDILVYYLTKSELNEFQLDSLCEVTNYMEHHCDKYLTECYFEASNILAEKNRENENYINNINEFAQKHLKPFINVILPKH